MACCGLCIGGAVLALYLLVKICKIFNISLCCCCKPKSNLKNCGEWAVVTGASDGIGKAYCHELAAKGKKIVLIARNMSKLEAVAKEIEENHGVETKIIVVDFSEGDAIVESVAKELKGMDVGILVNNVGVSYDYAKFMHELDTETTGKIIAVNCNSAVNMTNIVLEGMIERKRGIVVNMSSAAGVMPIGNPLYGVYSASKAFIEKLTRSNHYSYKKNGIFFQCQVPYFVASKMSKIRRASLTIPSPTTFAKQCVKALNINKPVIFPNWTHGLTQAILECLPACLVSSQIVKMHLGIRKKGMRKEAEKAAQQ
eukprot:TRINITY_DN773988_c0_g1_i1.p1 TRINITY_DN773988_c0_g1~~TRINITY_DN773988_c0_g1_i1.p1  ORF type:complete len:312 (+),score=89.50 TRINITY_DN773988_c0_g1_i1:14-949(+)